MTPLLIGGLRQVFDMKKLYFFSLSALCNKFSLNMIKVKSDSAECACSGRKRRALQSRRHAHRQKCLRQANPIGCAERQDVVVEIVAGVVQHARPRAVPVAAMIAVAIADKGIAARLFAQQIREVLCAHRGFYRAVYILCADDSRHHVRGQFRFRRVIDDRGRFASKTEFSNFAIVGGCGACAMLRIRVSIKSSASGAKARTVPPSRAVSGMTFNASPACNWVMDNTAVSSGFLLRVIMLCSPLAI